MVDTVVERSALVSSARRQQLPCSIARPASALVTVPALTAASASAAGAMCSVDRRLVRRELLTWAKKIPVVVGTSNYITSSAGLQNCSETNIALFQIVGFLGVFKNFFCNLIHVTFLIVIFEF